MSVHLPYEGILSLISGPSGDDAKISSIMPLILSLSSEQQHDLESEPIRWSVESGCFDGVPDWRELAATVKDWEKSEELEDKFLYFQWVVIYFCPKVLSSCFQKSSCYMDVKAGTDTFWIKYRHCIPAPIIFQISKMMKNDPSSWDLFTLSHIIIDVCAVGDPCDAEGIKDIKMVKTWQNRLLKVKTTSSKSDLIHGFEECLAIVRRLTKKFAAHLECDLENKLSLRNDRNYFRHHPTEFISMMFDILSFECFESLGESNEPASEVSQFLFSADKYAPLDGKSSIDDQDAEIARVLSDWYESSESDRVFEFQIFNSHIGGFEEPEYVLSDDDKVRCVVFSSEENTLSSNRLRVFEAVIIKELCEQYSQVYKMTPDFRDSENELKDILERYRAEDLADCVKFSEISENGDVQTYTVLKNLIETLIAEGLRGGFSSIVRGLRACTNRVFSELNFVGKMEDFYRSGLFFSEHTIATKSKGSAAFLNMSFFAAHIMSTVLTYRDCFALERLFKEGMMAIIFGDTRIPGVCTNSGSTLSSSTRSQVVKLLWYNSSLCTLKDIDAAIRDRIIIDKELPTPEYCDFLCDFGLSERFLLDGDALLCQALSNKLLDWQNGGQFLHLVYICEHFLENLRIRGALFELFFLVDNDPLIKNHGDSYLLARRILMRHLSYYIANQEKDHIFPLKMHTPAGSWLSDPERCESFRSEEKSFHDLLLSFKPAFILSNNSFSGNKVISAAQQYFVHTQLVLGFNVITLEGMTFDGSRVMGFLNGPPGPSKKPFLQAALQNIKKALVEEVARNSEMSDCFPPCEDEQYTEKSSKLEAIQPVEPSSLRTYLLLSAFKKIVRMQGEQDTRFLGLAAVGCVCLNIMDDSSLMERVVMLPRECAKFGLLKVWTVTDAFATCVQKFLHLLHKELLESVRLIDFKLIDSTIADIFDGRLFHFVLCLLVSGESGLPESLIASSLNIFEGSCVSPAPDLQTLILGLKNSEDELIAARNFIRLVLDHRERTSIFPKAVLMQASKEGSLLSNVLGDVSLRMSEHEGRLQHSVPLKTYTPQHFHSYRLLTNEPDSFVYDLWGTDDNFISRSNGKRTKWLLQGRLRAVQKKRAADLRYQENLLVGSPVSKQIIAELYGPERLLTIRETATKALQVQEGKKSGHFPALSNAAQPSIANTRQGKSTRCSQKESKKDLIVKKNMQDRLDKETQAQETKLHYFEKQHRGDQACIQIQKLEEFMAREKLFPSVATKAWLILLDKTLKMSVDGGMKRKRVFVIIQRMLRDKLVDPVDIPSILVDALQQVGFRDFASVLGSKKATSKSGQGGHSSIRFQLQCAPEHLSRPEGARADDRVQFKPDDWQLTLLDVVDSGNSALVVAPTASGKTFICYYVMEQCLRESNSSIVVYVAPTKALVEQVQAEIRARFSKTYAGNQVLTGVFTRDFRINPMNCQILVTVPACLEILLLSASNVEWGSRIRHVIFDEVHCIGESGGEVWERLILLINCPFLALSATLGNVKHFHEWLDEVEETRNRRVFLVEHTERYNDLCPWLYAAHDNKLLHLHPCWVLQNQGTTSSGLGFRSDACQGITDSEKASGDRLSEDCSRNLPLSPAAHESGTSADEDLPLSKKVAQKAEACLAKAGSKSDTTHEHNSKSNSAGAASDGRFQPDISKGVLPRDLKFLPEDDVALFEEMSPYLSDPARQRLDPDRFFATQHRVDAEGRSDVFWNLSMRDAAFWDKELKSEFFNLNQRAQDSIIASLTGTVNTAFSTIDSDLSEAGEESYVLNHISKLIVLLKSQEMLPAICFRINRKGCERLAKKLAKYFSTMEQNKRKKEGWSNKFDTLKKSQETHQKLLCKKKRPPQDVLDSGEAKSEDDEDYLNLMSNIQKIDLALFRMNEVDEDCAVQKVSLEDIEEAFGDLHHRRHWTDYVDEELIDPLCRGIGVHHAGMSLKYRQAVEKLFRLKKLGVIFATATLAMGINMPSKTSVFVGDAFYLNAMNFRQMAGRAGRRGFDLRGHTVYLGVQRNKCLRLMKSEVPNLQGNLLLNNSTVLRLVIRQYSLGECFKDDKPKKLDGMISCSRLVGHPLFSVNNLMNKQLAHSFRFSVEYLLRENFLRFDEERLELVPSDLSGFVAHLFFAEPSNFAFVTLLVAKGVDGEKSILSELCSLGEETVLTVLCHIFNRKLCPQRIAIGAGEGPSKVILPRLTDLGDIGERIVRIFQEQKQSTLDSLVEYWECFVSSYADEMGSDCVLPLTQTRFQVAPSGERTLGPFRPKLKPHVRSAFYALSGHGHVFESIQELSTSCRGGLFIDPKMVPIFDEYDENVTLNSYLLDFYKHGQIESLIKYNKITRDSVWERLRSFSLVLKVLWGAMDRRSRNAQESGEETEFNDPLVLKTFCALSSGFADKLKEAAV